MFSIFKRDESRLCVKCKHYYEPDLMCRRPYPKPRVNLVSGIPETRPSTYATCERGGNINTCGPSGRFYEEAK